jgi:hypothetical protein
LRIGTLSPGIPPPAAQHETKLPLVEDCQPHRPKAATSAVIAITGTGDHDPLDQAIAIKRNQ